MKNNSLFLTCEHAGNEVPEKYKKHFKDAADDLQSHKGWDPGALQITQKLAEKFNLGYDSVSISRLLIEVNRSIGHEDLFSKYTNDLTLLEKNELIRTVYKPYRNKVVKEIGKSLKPSNLVVHISVHTFTPTWEGKSREVEIGLLFDENRKAEKSFCENWMNHLSNSTYNIRYNEPYNGADDGFTTHLRSLFGENEYFGIELEVSQKFVNSELNKVIEAIQSSLHQALETQ